MFRGFEKLINLINTEIRSTYCRSNMFCCILKIMFPFYCSFGFFATSVYKMSNNNLYNPVFDLLSIGFHSGLGAKVLLNVTQNENFKVFI